MLKLVVLKLLISFSMSFFIDIKLKGEGSTCSQSQETKIKGSIVDCIDLGLNLQSQCIKNSIQAALQDKWNVYIQAANTNSSLSIYSQKCDLELKTYGKFNQSYRIWNSQLTKSLHETKGLKLAQMNDDDCPRGYIETAQQAILFCQQAGQVSQVSSCIRNNILTKQGLKWNVIVTQAGASYSVRFEEYQGCMINKAKCGRKSRNILLWMALAV